jgi:hypothetical protein
LNLPKSVWIHASRYLIIFISEGQQRGLALLASLGLCWYAYITQGGLNDYQFCDVVVKILFFREDLFGRSGVMILLDPKINNPCRSNEATAECSSNSNPVQRPETAQPDLLLLARLATSFFPLCAMSASSTLVSCFA